MRARRTILASDAVSFLAAVVLYLLAVGGVRGFAFTLGLTTLIDVLVVFMFTHPMVALLARTKFFGGGHQLSGFDAEHLGRAVAYVGRGRVRTPARCVGAADTGGTTRIQGSGPSPSGDGRGAARGSPPGPDAGAGADGRRQRAETAAHARDRRASPSRRAKRSAADPWEGVLMAASASPSSATTSTPVAGRSTSSAPAHALVRDRRRRRAGLAARARGAPAQPRARVPRRLGVPGLQRRATPAS